MSGASQTLTSEEDPMVVYSNHCQAESSGSIILFQHIAKLEKADSLFYTDVLVNDVVTCQGLLDTGSMACTINERQSTSCWMHAGPLSLTSLLVGCGGVQIKPKCIYQLKMCVWTFGYRAYLGCTRAKISVNCWY